jgi:hypothetical protein
LKTLEDMSITCLTDDEQQFESHFIPENWFRVLNDVADEHFFTTRSSYSEPDTLDRGPTVSSVRDALAWLTPKSTWLAGYQLTSPRNTRNARVI